MASETEELKSQMAELQRQLGLLIGGGDLARAAMFEDRPTSGSSPIDPALPSFAGKAIPLGLTLIYGEPPWSRQFQGWGYGRWAAAINMYHQHIRNWRGLILPGHPEYPDVDEEALEQYASRGMGAPVFFHGKMGPAAAFLGGGVKYADLWVAHDPQKRNDPCPLRPYRWEASEYSALEVADASLADTIAANYQEKRFKDGLKVVNPIDNRFRN